MSLAEDFVSAQTRIKQLPKNPTTQELLELYGLYKQASSGDVAGSRPGMLDLKGRAKYDAWAKRQGTSADDAMRGYVELVNELTKKYAAG
jgi:diazepam-binding inhibitor (GABA receptor modulator, acyl-CoA-binding protein)